MDRNEIQNEFLMNYGWSPNSTEAAHFQRFCDGIATTEILIKCLDPKNHPTGTGGRRFKPNVATLYAIKDDILKKLYDFKELSGERDYYAEYDAEIEGWDCLYCCQGRVWDLVWSNNRWSLEDIGKCSICSNGDTVPRPEIIAKMEASKIPCLHIAGHLFLGIYAYRIRYGIGITEQGLVSSLATLARPGFAQPATVMEY